MEVPAQLTPSVAPTGAPGVFRTDRASPASFGALSGEATSRVGGAADTAGGVAANAAIAFQRQQNETDVDAANIAYDQKRRAMLFDENGGFYAKKGKDAYDAMAPTAQSIEQARTETKGALKNPEQQRMFDVISRRATEGDLRSMSIHAATENRSYRVGVAEASISNAMSDARAYWNDPVRFAQEIGQVKLFAENRAALLGRTDPAMLKSDISHYVGLAWDSRIRAAMLQDPKLADQMYRANSDAIADPVLRQNLEHALTVSVMPQEARADAEKAMTGGLAPGQQETSGQPDAGGAVPTSAVTGRGTDQVKLHEDNVASLQSEIARKGQTPANLKTLNAELMTEQAALQKAKAGGGAQPASMGGASAAPINSRDTHAMLAAWIPAAERLAEERKPGNAVYRDLVVQQVKGKVATIAAMQEGVERQAVDTLKGSILSTKATSMDQLMGDPKVVQALPLVPTASMQGLIALLDHNAREARGENVRSDPKVVQTLFNAIHADENAPEKIRNAEQLAPFFAKGLNWADYDRLGKEIEKSRNPEGNSFLRDVNNVRKTAGSMMKVGIVGRALADTQPEKIEEAQYSFSRYLDSKIDDYRKAGKDPRDLLNPAKPDYVLHPGVVQTFLKDPRAAMGDAANKVRAEAPPDKYDTKLTPDEETKFKEWKAKYAPKDSGADYDLRGAFKAGLTPDAQTGHWPDTFKKPNHETFSVESNYAKDAPDKAGSWAGPKHDIYIPAGATYVAGDSDFNRLAKNALYVGPDGVKRRKP